MHITERQMLNMSKFHVHGMLQFSTLNFKSTPIEVAAQGIYMWDDVIFDSVDLIGLAT